jgi:hypothetical protein
MSLGHYWQISFLLQPSSQHSSQHFFQSRSLEKLSWLVIMGICWDGGMILSAGSQFMCILLDQKPKSHWTITLLTRAHWPSSICMHVWHRLTVFCQHDMFLSEFFFCARLALFRLGSAFVFMDIVSRVYWVWICNCHGFLWTTRWLDLEIYTNNQTRIRRFMYACCMHALHYVTLRNIAQHYIT